MENICIGAIVLLFLLVLLTGDGFIPKKKRGRKRGGSRRSRKPVKRGNGTITIYKLMDGRRAFYVGQTTQPLERRLAQHIDDLSGNDKSYYISTMRRNPRIVAITSTRSQAKANKPAGRLGADGHGRSGR